MARFAKNASAFAIVLLAMVAMPARGELPGETLGSTSEPNAAGDPPSSDSPPAMVKPSGRNPASREQTEPEAAVSRNEGPAEAGGFDPQAFPGYALPQPYPNIEGEHRARIEAFKEEHRALREQRSEIMREAIRAQRQLASPFPWTGQGRDSMLQRSEQAHEAMRERRAWLNPRGTQRQDMHEKQREAIKEMSESERERMRQIMANRERMIRNYDPYGWAPYGPASPWSLPGH